MHHLLSLVLLGLCLGWVAAVDPLVDLTYNKYRGVKLGNGVTQWLGMRYSKSATAKNGRRFAAPEDPGWELKTIDADHFKPVCIGTFSEANDDSTSEDCLFANVFAPSSATTSSKLPVYVFIQGGGFNSNANANFNGSSLVLKGQKNLIVVNFNYRVGPYGFLASDAVKSGASLNNGLKDQRQLLRWVNQNIAKFGGDPNHVTLGGASAGAGSVLLQLTYGGGSASSLPQLFHAAAAESQNMPVLRTPAQSQFLYDKLLTATGCKGKSNPLNCLKTMDIVTFQKASRSINVAYPGAPSPPVFLYSPTLDGDVIKDYTYREFANGHFWKMPTIMGDVSNEGTIFTPRTIDTQAASDNFLVSNFPALTAAQLNQLHARYPKGAQYPNTGAYWSQAAELFGDLRYACPGLYVSNAFARHGRADAAWHYRWDVVSATNRANGLGATHVAELGEIWAANPASGSVADAIQSYWVSFARTYTPNALKVGTAPVWDPWGGEDGEGGFRRLRFGSGDVVAMESVSAYQRGQCEVVWGMGVALGQ